MSEQLPSGLRAKSATALTVPVTLPAASANCPVPPVTSQVSCCVPVNRQLWGLMKNDRSPSALTTCMVPLGKTRSSWPSGCESSTTRPTPRNTPLARTTLPMTVRVSVPGTAEDDGAGERLAPARRRGQQAWLARRK